MARILVVDDDEAARTYARTILRGAGHSVLDVGAAAQALDALRLERFDCVLLDLVLPDAGGETVLRAMRMMPKRADIPVVVVTDRNDAHTVERETTFGVVDHLVKPVPPAMLVAALDRALRGAPTWLEDHRRILHSGAEVHRDAERLIEKARASRVRRLIIDLRERRARARTDTEIEIESPPVAPRR